jgi:hypothetical protein
LKSLLINQQACAARPLSRSARQRAILPKMIDGLLEKPSMKFHPPTIPGRPFAGENLWSQSSRRPARRIYCRIK